MIKAFLFENFKGFEKAELYLEDTTILIGANASGKSNALEGIAILAELARGRSITDILDGTRNSGGMVRGGSVGCCRQGSNSFTLGCLMDWDEEKDLLYRVTIHVGDTVCIEKESLAIVPNNDTEEQTDWSRLIFIAEANHSITCIKFTKHLINSDTPWGFSPSNVSAFYFARTSFKPETAKFKAVKIMMDALTHISVISPVPENIMEESLISETALKHDCSNLASSLYSLGQDEKKKNALLDMICRLPENAIEDIGFDEIRGKKVLFYLKEKQGDRTVEINSAQLSDGTLRSLAIATAMLGEPEGSVVVVDEVDTGIHPSRAKFLIEWLHKTGVERKIDVLVTTHNVSLLNSLENEMILGVSVAYRDKNEGGSKIVSFVDLEDASLILANGGIGTASEKEKLLSSMEPKKPFEMPEWLVNKE